MRYAYACMLSHFSHVLTLCDPVDSSLLGSSVHWILQARPWSGLPDPPSGDLLSPGIEPEASVLQVDSSLLHLRYVYIRC